MTDQITSVSHDPADDSYTFLYHFDDGVHPPVTRTINILNGESVDLVSAKTLADQRASDAKQAWQDDLALLQTVIGPVVLPQSSKSLGKIQSIESTTDLSGA